MVLSAHSLRRLWCNGGIKSTRMVTKQFLLIATGHPVAFFIFRAYDGSMPIVKCKICTKQFYAKPNWIIKGWGKYCSPKCQHEGRRNGKFVACFICDKKVYRTPKNIRSSKSRKYFCGKSCQTVWRNSMVFVGRNHPNWKGGFFSYRDIIRRSKKKVICTLCQLKDKRILAVHHIDHNHKNNNLTNLAWLCHNCHFLVHHHKDQRLLLETLV